MEKINSRLYSKGNGIHTINDSIRNNNAYVKNQYRLRIKNISISIHNHSKQVNKIWTNYNKQQENVPKEQTKTTQKWSIISQIIRHQATLTSKLMNRILNSPFFISIAKINHSSIVCIIFQFPLQKIKTSTSRLNKGLQ